MHSNTYTLINNNNNSDTFYNILSNYTDLILSNSFNKLGFILDGYYSFISRKNLEKLRTKEEYLLEYISIGIFWHNYAAKARKMPNYSESILSFLYNYRNKYRGLKSSIDSIRGVSAYLFLERRVKENNTEFDLGNFKRLMKWMKATGEYNEELQRFSNWVMYFNSINKEHLASMLKLTVEYSEEFTNISHSILGEFTKNVNKFRNKAKKSYKFREDYFLARRMENEYFLNIFGAEVMNRQLKESFVKTKDKAVLLPTCMRKSTVKECKAKWDGKGNVCSHCDKNCNIGKIAEKFRGDAVNVYLIPHSSSFSVFLNNWANQKETGLIGVACVLNLLTGGYEMKRLNIASQCVFLDYCACKKHWDNKGYNTSLNVNQLKEIVQMEQKQTSVA
jgi:hypothetical protein